MRSRRVKLAILSLVAVDAFTFATAAPAFTGHTETASACSPLSRYGC